MSKMPKIKPARHRGPLRRGGRGFYIILKKDLRNGAKGRYHIRVLLYTVFVLRYMKAVCAVPHK